MTSEALLASWRDTPTRAAIADFVRRITDEGGAEFIPPAERVAVFDNDGTLWSEKPIPIQLDFTLFRMAELAEAETSLKQRQPYKAAVDAITLGSVRPWSSITTVTTPISDS